MNGLIRASLSNPYAVTVFCLTLLVVGTLCLFMIPIDILRSSRARRCRC